MIRSSKLRSRFSDFKIYLKPVCLRMFFLGFSAGLPLLLVLGTLGFWLREAGIDLKTIGFLSWVGLVYGCKGCGPWSQRQTALVIRAFRSASRVLALSQVMLIISLAGMAFSNPQTHMPQIVVFALLTAFCSATQDISLDAYRIESASADLQGALAATYQTGYRLDMIGPAPRFCSGSLFPIGSLRRLRSNRLDLGLPHHGRFN